MTERDAELVQIRFGERRQNVHADVVALERRRVLLQPEVGKPLPDALQRPSLPARRWSLKFEQKLTLIGSVEHSI
jgi:hypothetical protein